MKLKWNKTIQIPEGSHSGEITRIVSREEPYEYTDIFIKIDGLDNIEIRYGCPTFLSEKSKLGRLLKVFGEEFTPDKEIEIENVLIGKKVTFMTINKKNKDNVEYAEVIEDSIKPVKQTENRIQDSVI